MTCRSVYVRHRSPFWRPRWRAGTNWQSNPTCASIAHRREQTGRKRIDLLPRDSAPNTTPGAKPAHRLTAPAPPAGAVSFWPNFMASRGPNRSGAGAAWNDFSCVMFSGRVGLPRPTQCERGPSFRLKSWGCLLWRAGIPIPIEVWPNIRAPLATGLADEAVRIGQPDMVGPLAAAHLNRMAAAVVGAIDQHVADTHLAHLAEVDLLGAGHRALEARAGRAGNQLRGGSTIPPPWASRGLQARRDRAGQGTEARHHNRNHC
jgi:hypothetical protein